MFRNACKTRGWFAGKNDVPTHFLLDGGKLHVPDECATAFLNVYFISAVVKRERVSLVELKTRDFKLFFDLDATYDASRSTPEQIRTALEQLTIRIQSSVARFFVQGTDTTCVACTAPVKHVSIDSAGSGGSVTPVKYGVHLVFPHIIVNAPISLRVRSMLLEYLDSVSPHVVPLNAMDDIVDDSVFKANGLRAVYATKGKDETRPYTPSWRVTDGEVVNIDESIAPEEAREYVSLCSIRSFDRPLSECVGGENQMIDIHESKHATIGTSTSIEQFASAIPGVRAALPPVYRTVRFTGAFVTDNTVYLKSDSRFCHNKGSTHQTSTVYFAVTRNGVCQRCYCRKSGRGCDTYTGPVFPLGEETLLVFFPGFIDDDVTKRVARIAPAKRRSNLDNVLKRTRLLKKKG